MSKITNIVVESISNNPKEWRIFKPPTKEIKRISKMKNISEEFAQHLWDLLEDAKINSCSLLIEHDDELGRTTEANRNIALYYEKEIEEITIAIHKIKDVIDQ